MIGAIRTSEDGRWYRLSLGALILSAWLVMGLWGVSPHAGWLHHREIGEIGASTIFRLAIFVFGWTLMTIATMLPGSLPLLNLFGLVTLGRPDRGVLMARLVTGYLVTWATFGAVAFVGDLFLHEMVERVAVLSAVSWGIPPTVLLTAGVYQFTPLKEMCLSKCRSPYSFLVGHWHGEHPAQESWQLGIRHGVFCVGCCWTLMLLMFAVGVAHLGWMLGLGAIMAAERTTVRGKRLTRPLGVALVLWALFVAAGKVTFLRT